MTAESMMSKCLVTMKKVTSLIGENKGDQTSLHFHLRILLRCYFDTSTRIKLQFEQFCGFSPLSAETSAPRTPQPRRGPAQKWDPVNSQYVVLFTQRYDKGALNKPSVRFNIFFVLTRAMWGPIPYLCFWPWGALQIFLKNSSRKTSKQTFSSIPRAPHPQVNSAKISFKNVISSHR